MKKVLLTATVQSHICQFHRPLVEMLQESGEFEIHVAARNNLAEKNGLALDFADRVYDVPFRRSPFDLKNLAAYRQLKRIIRENHYDIIHCNTPVGGVLTRLAAMGARKRGTRVLYTAHGFHFYQGAPRKNWLVYYPIEWALSHCTDTLITINEEDFRLAEKKLGCPVARIHGTGVDPLRYAPVSGEEVLALKKKLGFSPQAKLILCIGELLPNKNQKMAIDAMEDVAKACPEAVLLLAGNGPERENLEKQIRQKGLEDRVKLLGYCTNLQDYQRVSEISVSCSIREGLGLNLIESMLSRNPVVATHNRGHDELVRDGENGYLVSADDCGLLAQRICEILLSPEKKAEMGQRGEKFAQKYTTDVVKRELKAIYFE